MGSPWDQQAAEDMVEVLCSLYPEVSCRRSFCELRTKMQARAPRWLVACSVVGWSWLVGWWGGWLRVGW